MPTPDTGSLGLSGAAPSFLVDRRIAPGETALSFNTYAPTVTVDINSLVLNLPMMLATFTDRRRIIRESLEVVRDTVYLNRQTEMYIALELNGEVFDAAGLTDLELLYENADQSVQDSILIADYPEVFDLSTRMVVRGQTVNILRLVISDALLAELFSTGLWSMELYADNVQWGELEWEIRSLFEGVVVVPNSGSMSFTEYTPTVRYDRAATLTGELIFGGLAPRVTVQSIDAIYAGELTMTGYAPILSPIFVPTGSLVMSGMVPAVSSP